MQQYFLSYSIHFYLLHIFSLVLLIDIWGLTARLLLTHALEVLEIKPGFDEDKAC